MFTIKSIYIHQGCSHLKNLKEDQEYSFGHRLEENFFAPNITISAIVGENGSGKSSLLDMMFRILNNFGFCLFKGYRRSAADLMTYIEDIYADLFFCIDGVDYAIMCRGGFVAINFGEYRYKFTHVAKKTELDSDWRQKYEDYQEWRGKGDVLRKLTKTFFYYCNQLFYAIVHSQRLRPREYVLL